MSEPENFFRAWMDSKDLKAEDVTEPLGISTQTVHHWRSQGVPQRRQEHARRIIAEWDNRPTLSNLILRPDSERFSRWCAAACEAREPFDQWVHNSLDRKAEEEFHRQPLKVADAAITYRSASKDAADARDLADDVVDNPPS